MNSYRQLPLWRQSHVLATDIFRATCHMRRDAQRDLAARLRDAALTIPVEIASYYSSDGRYWLVGLRQARRALVRLEHLVHVACQLHDWPPSRATRIVAQLARVRRHLQSMIRCLSPPPPPRCFSLPIPQHDLPQHDVPDHD